MQLQKTSQLQKTESACLQTFEDWVNLWNGNVSVSMWTTLNGFFLACSAMSVFFLSSFSFFHFSSSSRRASVNQTIPASAYQFLRKAYSLYTITRYSLNHRMKHKWHVIMSEIKDIIFHSFVPIISNTDALELDWGGRAIISLRSGHQPHNQVVAGKQGTLLCSIWVISWYGNKYVTLRLCGWYSTLHRLHNPYISHSRSYSGDAAATSLVAHSCRHTVNLC